MALLQAVYRRRGRGLAFPEAARLVAGEVLPVQTGDGLLAGCCRSRRWHRRMTRVRLCGFYYFLERFCAILSIMMREAI